MSWEDWTGRRKRRPRTRVIADMSVNFLERQVLRRGHRLIRIPEESDDADEQFPATKKRRERRSSYACISQTEGCTRVPFSSRRV